MTRETKVRCNQILLLWHCHVGYTSFHLNPEVSQTGTTWIGARLETPVAARMGLDTYTSQGEWTVAPITGIRTLR